MAGLSYKIGADVTDFRSGINEAIKDLSRFDKATQQAVSGVANNFKSLDRLENQLQSFKNGLTKATSPESFARLQRAIDATTRRIELMRNPVDALGRGLGQLPNRANGAAAALTSVGQVARDLPFGFIAIQNNLPIVLDQFTALSRQSDGVLPALKAVGGALVGPAGLAFAFGAVTAGITAVIQKYGSLDAALVALVQNNDAAAVAQRNLNKAIDEANASTTGEVLKLQNLVAALANATNANEVRLNAYRELKKTYPGVIQDLTEENALTSDGAQLIATRSQELIKYIKLKGQEAALISLIEEATKAQLKAQRDAAAALEAQTGPRNVKTFLADALALVKAGGNVAEAALGPIIEAGEAFNKAGKEIDLFGSKLASIQQDRLSLDASIVTPGKTGTPAAPKTPRARAAKIEVPIEVLPPLAQNVQDAVKVADEEIQKQFRQQEIGVPITISPVVPQGAQDAFAAFAEQQAIEQLGNQAIATAEAFNNFLAPSVDAVFGAIANGANINEALRQSFRALVVQIGIAIAKAAVLAGILSIINPTGAAAAGLGSNFGSIFKNLFSGFAGLPKFAEGGIVTRPTFGLFGEAGAEAVIPLDKLNAMLSNFGGGSNIMVGGALTLRGNDLVAAVARTNQQQGRAF